MRVELDAAQVDDPGEARGIVHDDLLGSAPRRERQGYRSQPGGPLVGRALLIERLALCAVDEALEDDRTISNPSKSTRSDR